MDAKESLSNLLTLLTRCPHLTESIDVEGEDMTAVTGADKATDMEVASKLLGLCSSNFSDIAEGLDNIASLNSAADDFNQMMTEMIESFDKSYQNIHSEVGSLLESSHNATGSTEASPSPLLPLKTPSRDQIAKYKFISAALEDNLAKMKVYPYYQPPEEAVLSKRMRQQDDDDGIVTSLDRCLSRDDEAVLTLQALDEVSRHIVDLRKQNDIEEELLNVEYNYSWSRHLLPPAQRQAREVDDKQERCDESTLTDRFVEEIRQLEAECLQMDDDLSRAMHHGY